MGRPKGGKNREWSKEQKLEVINYFFSGHTQRDTCVHFAISRRQLDIWLTRYNEQGIEGLQNKRKPGNPLSKYSRRKELTPLEQLEYENMLLRIENERLKKGYTEEDAIIAKSSIRNMR
ncbi:MAG: helix-turn-helix domain containing protein [Lachnospiraceae bacterium]|nr:helix-turn-helix domain containing protein [Lachnospiraceae bacterium]